MLAASPNARLSGSWALVVVRFCPCLSVYLSACLLSSRLWCPCLCGLCASVVSKSLSASLTCKSSEHLGTTLGCRVHAGSLIFCTTTGYSSCSPVRVHKKVSEDDSEVTSPTQTSQSPARVALPCASLPIVGRRHLPGCLATRESRRVWRLQTRVSRRTDACR